MDESKRAQVRAQRSLRRAALAGGVGAGQEPGETIPEPEPAQNPPVKGSAEVLLDGTVDEVAAAVKAELAKNPDRAEELLAAEKAGKDRKGVKSAIEAATASAE